MHTMKSPVGEHESDDEDQISIYFWIPLIYIK